MNERIQELWRQVDTIQYDRVYGNIYRPYIPLQIAGEPTRFEITDIHLEKFAELIVKECAKVAGDFEYARLHDSLVEDKIKEHFGVEE